MPQTDIGSPGWWLRRLHGRIVARRPVVQKLHDYYDGVHHLGFASQKFLEAFGGLFRAFSDNWCGIVVEAAEDRLNVEGFRIGTEAQPDVDAWNIWQQNELDAQSQMAHLEALICGEAYVTTWFGDDLTTPEITVESPSTAIVETHPKRRCERLAGLRVYLDEANYEHAELFLPDEVYVYRSKTKRGDFSDPVDPARIHWVIDEWLGLDLDNAGSMANPLGVVPMVPLANRPRLGYGSRSQLSAQSEISGVVPLQDAVNKLVADMMVASEYAAMPQRYMLGLEELPRNEAGQEINPFTPDKRVWLGEGDAQGMKIGEFSAADLGNYVKAIELLIQHVASITRTPPHYLNASADRLSGESIKAAETGLVAKVLRKQRHFGEAWEEVIRLAGQISGNAALANAETAETIWADPESRTESQHVDAVQKKQAMGVPWEQSMEDLGYTPTQIARMRRMREEDQAAGLGPVPVASPFEEVTPPGTPAVTAPAPPGA